MCEKRARAFLGKERKRKSKDKKYCERVSSQAQTRKKKKKNLGKPPLLIKPRKREYKHVETKRFDVRGKSARQQQPNENGVGRAEERNGCVFFFSSRERASLSLSL